jgi:hypothetical protein
MGQELGTPAQLAQVMQAYGTQHALLVGPNSGYGSTTAACSIRSRASPDATGDRRRPNDITLQCLASLKRQGWSASRGTSLLRPSITTATRRRLLEKLAALDMFVDIQVEHEQLVHMLPLLSPSGCASSSITAVARRWRGLDEPAFARCLRSAHPARLRQALGAR